MAGPWEQYQSASASDAQAATAANAGPWQKYQQPEQAAGKATPRDFIQEMNARDSTDFGYGVRRAVRDAWDTGAELLARGFDKLAGSSEYERVKRDNDAARAQDTAGRPVTAGSVLGYVGGNALASTPVLKGTQLALGATGVPLLQQLGNAILSGGMTTNAAKSAPLAARAVDMGVRMAGGGIGGYVSGGLADPDSAGTAGVIGMATPPVAAGLGTAGAQVRRVVRDLRTPSDAKLAAQIAEMGGAAPGDLAAMADVRDALRQQGPNIIEGSLTVPQILQTPQVSQLQRTVRATVPGSFQDAEAARELARRNVLERMGPIGNRAEVAQDVGNAITDYAIPQHEAARAAVRAKFGAVDPFGESQVLLPVDQMQAAKDKFLGPGTFGSGGMAQQAVDEARRIGTQELPAIRPAATGRQPQDIAQAVRSLGGINPNSAGGMNREIAELGRRQTGTTGLVSAKGRTVDELAEALHERGFLNSPDPAELLDALRANLSGRKVYAADVPENAFRAGVERAMGDAPQAERIGKPVSFEELQNLRSSIGEQWRIATRAGNAKEAAALDAQRRAIDSTLDRIASGGGQPGEYFAPDMVANYQDARATHAAKEARFRTGPQAAIFRNGSDGVPLAQGAEVPGRFFNAKPSQVADAESFTRLVQNDPQMMGELRRYAASDAAGQVDRIGNLTSAKFNRWLDQRSGAVGVTFTDQQRAWLKAIADDLRRADVAENMGRATGSDTMQKAASMMKLGVLDSKATDAVVNAKGGAAGNFLLNVLRSPMRGAKANRLAELLNNPEVTASALDTFIATRKPAEQNALLQILQGGAYRGAPVLMDAGQ